LGESVGCGKYREQAEPFIEKALLWYGMVVAREGKLEFLFKDGTETEV
jgi:hypothetical protein